MHLASVDSMDKVEVRMRETIAIGAQKSYAAVEKGKGITEDVAKEDLIGQTH